MADKCGFKSVTQVGVVSADAPALIAFYRDVMGCPVMFEAGGMTFIQAGATSLMIAGGTEPAGTDVILYFEPEDWDTAEAQLTTAGIAFEREAQVVQREATREHMLRPFQDPEGRRLYLLGWRPTT